MPRRGRVAVLGGTFDRLHRGHEALFAAAFRAAPSVGVGVTTDRFLRAQHKPYATRIEPYARRRAVVRRFLRARYPSRSWWLAALDDPWGRSVERDVDVLVASEETASSARRVNDERRRRGFPPVRLALVPLVRGEDGLSISSRRIRAGTIDREGRRRRPLVIGVVVGGPVELPVARSAARSRFSPLPTRISVRRERSRSPVARRGPRAAASQSAMQALKRGEYGIGIVASPRARGLWIALADAEGLIGVRRVARPDGLARALGALRR